MIIFVQFTCFYVNIVQSYLIHGFAFDPLFYPPHSSPTSPPPSPRSPRLASPVRRTASPRRRLSSPRRRYSSPRTSPCRSPLSSSGCPGGPFPPSSSSSSAGAGKPPLVTIPSVDIVDHCGLANSTKGEREDQDLMLLLSITEFKCLLDSQCLALNDVHDFSFE